MRWEDIIGSAPELGPGGFAVRAMLVGAMLYVMSRLLPRRSGGQFAGYDFAFFWMMGGLAASPLFDSRINFTNTITAIATVYAWHYAISYLAVKSPAFARIAFGTPILLLARGKLIRRNARKALMPIELILSEMRNVDAHNPAEVEYAVMETSGHVSVLRKSAAQPVSAGDLNLSPVEPGLPILLVNDGKVLQDGLRGLGHSLDWLQDELRKHGVADVRDVYLATIDGTGNLYYSLTNEQGGGRSNVD